MQKEGIVDINSLIREIESLNNIQVEITDDYLRVKGNTYSVRGKLKLLGFQWNPKTREWYCSTAEELIGTERFNRGER